MVLLCLLFWAVTLPVAGLLELGVLVTNRVDHSLHYHRQVLQQ